MLLTDVPRPMTTLAILTIMIPFVHTPLAPHNDDLRAAR